MGSCPAHSTSIRPKASLRWNSRAASAAVIRSVTCGARARPAPVSERWAIAPCPSLSTITVVWPQRFAPRAGHAVSPTLKTIVF